MRQNKKGLHNFTLADQDWIGLIIFQKYCGSGLDRIQFHRIRTGFGLKNFTVRSSLIHLPVTTLSHVAPSPGHNSR